MNKYLMCLVFASLITACKTKEPRYICELPLDFCTNCETVAQMKAFEAAQQGIEIRYRDPVYIWNKREGAWTFERPAYFGRFAQTAYDAFYESDSLFETELSYYISAEKWKYSLQGSYGLKFWHSPGYVAANQAKFHKDSLLALYHHYSDLLTKKLGVPPAAQEPYYSTDSFDAFNAEWFVSSDGTPCNGHLFSIAYYHQDFLLIKREKIVNQDSVYILKDAVSRFNSKVKFKLPVKIPVKCQ
jgi:hypothetical protein